MRLINIETLKIESFGDDPPPFAILSHTWGPDEVTLQDVLNPRSHEPDIQEGWRKIVGFCRTVRNHFHSTLEGPARYAWVDTCCIDKTSSAELSEAINSMFRWYRHASACYVLLSDVSAEGAPSVDLASAAARVGDDFEASRWFTRGWTLQELLAPRQIYFFDQKWKFIGDKMSLSKRIVERTKIDQDAILVGSWEHTSIAQRMSWAADRQTTRREDMAYCLMGIFDVNMPLLYGEGDKAFIRLQEEIMKESGDQSILAWDASGKHGGLPIIGALATHPSQFLGGAAVEALPSETSLSITHKGIQCQLEIIVQQTVSDGDITVALLDCRYAKDLSSRVGLPVRRMATSNMNMNSTQQFVRTPSPPINIPLQRNFGRIPPTMYLIKREKVGASAYGRLWRCWVRYGSVTNGFKPVLAVPKENWHISPAQSMTMTLPQREGVIVTAVVFRFDTGPENRSYCMVLKLDLHTRTGSVGLRDIEVGDDSDSEEALKPRLDGLIRNADSIARTPAADVALPHGTLHAALTGVGDHGSMFDCVLSSSGPL